LESLTFDRDILAVYSEEDRGKGYIQVPNRHGKPQKFPVTSISIAGVTNRYRDFKNYWEIPEVAAELKKRRNNSPVPVLYLTAVKNRRTHNPFFTSF
jgi:hypothetical protein